MNTDIFDSFKIKLSDIHLDFLTNRVRARLDFIIFHLENEVCINADYFGSDIQLKIKSNGYDWPILQCHISISNNEGVLELKMVQKSDNIDTLILKTIRPINKYIKTRPFTIIRYSHGQHKLLDPNGMDYIGQYTTLSDAKKTSLNNFLL
jgi:hypothetical protein